LYSPLRVLCKDLYVNVHVGQLGLHRKGGGEGGGVSSLPVASAGADCRQCLYNFLLITVSEQVEGKLHRQRVFRKNGAKEYTVANRYQETLRKIQNVELHGFSRRKILFW